MNDTSVDEDAAEEAAAGPDPEMVEHDINKLEALLRKRAQSAGVHDG